MIEPRKDKYETGTYEKVAERFSLRSELRDPGFWKEYFYWSWRCLLFVLFIVIATNFDYREGIVRSFEHISATAWQNEQSQRCCLVPSFSFAGLISGSGGKIYLSGNVRNERPQLAESEYSPGKRVSGWFTWHSSRWSFLRYDGGLSQTGHSHHPCSVSMTLRGSRVDAPDRRAKI